MLFPPAEESVDGVEVFAADTSVDTPLPEGLQVGLRVGEVAPDFEFSTYEGERVRLSDYRGSPAMINFWATWCIPCFTEMPAIDEAKRRYADVGFVVIAMNKGERYSVAVNWLADQGLDFTAFGHDPDEAVYRRYTGGGIPGLPISFFLDAEGVITEVVYGPLRPSDLDFNIERSIHGYERVSN
jgi:thiol-disulfide isomerase/thioredoxin